MAPTNIELCYKCATDPSTLSNMNSVIIVEMRRVIASSKYCIVELSKSNGHDHTEAIKVFSKQIVDNTLAIQAFYSRHPEVKMARCEYQLSRLNHDIDALADAGIPPHFKDRYDECIKKRENMVNYINNYLFKVYPHLKC